METVRDRLKQVMDEMGLKPLTPASTCEGITKNMMHKLWNQSTTGDVTSKILVPFCNHYTNVNCNWLLRGDGEMFIKESDKIGSSVSNSQHQGTDDTDNYYKHILRELLNADMAIADAELRKKELYAQIVDKI